MVQMQLALKGNGRWDSDWFIAHYAQNTPITQGVIGCKIHFYMLFELKCVLAYVLTTTL